MDSLELFFPEEYVVLIVIEANYGVFSIAGPDCRVQLLDYVRLIVDDLQSYF